MIGPGQRNRYVALYKPDAGQDGYGQPLSTYSFVGFVWADIRPVTQHEYVASRQTEARIDAVFRLPWRTARDVQATWIIVYDGQTYDIQSQGMIGYHEGLQLLTRVRQQ
jgi:SPP1 family predicted phage head-tail adaptor